jgi:hypothetical protein
MVILKHVGNGKHHIRLIRGIEVIDVHWYDIIAIDNLTKIDAKDFLDIQLAKVKRFRKN